MKWYWEETSTRIKVVNAADDNADTSNAGDGAHTKSNFVHECGG